MPFDIVCFDCDSTLSRIEGIDELARSCHVFAEVAALTDAAMNGEVALEDVYAKRLDVIKPNQHAISQLADQYIDEIVEGVTEVFAALLAANKQVHIISGGLRQAILPLATRLNIPASQVHAVDIFFDVNGDYLDFDRQSPLAQSGGKAAVCRQINPSAALNMVLVGDGKTDLEAQHAGATVIGFGGVVRRDLVEAQADQFFADPSLLAVLPVLLQADSN
ncbi:MAG: haloacid dehalogenase [Methylococcaceae bacterium]|jgi:phosphoserine phosphatase|nr:haloacid dehalogenase [Methylococcaceae bacterium]